MRTRLITPADTPAVLDMVVQAFSESRYVRYKLKLDALLELIETQPGTVFCLVLEDGAQLVGFLCAVVTSHYFVDITYASNIAWYVAPSHRNGVLRLLRAYQKEARLRGASEVQLGVTAGGTGCERTERLYNALGFHTVGALTVKYIGE